MALPEVIRRRRKAKGLTQQDVAAQARLGLRTVQRVENGSHYPTVATLGKLAAVLGTTADRLLVEAARPQEPEAASA